MKSLLRFRPDTRRLTIAEEFKVNQVGVAADGTILHILLLAAATSVQRDDDLFAAGGAGV